MENLRTGPIVRAINSEQVAVWTEWTGACEVIVRVAPTVTISQSAFSGSDVLSVAAPTVCVGGRYYALSVVTGLQAGTWYTYRISIKGEQADSSLQEERLLCCFRTFDLPDAGTPLRLAYGSCRKLSSPEADVLSAFGHWLIDCQEERESRWPRLLLLIGDQIYADEDMVGPVLRNGPRKSSAMQSFEDFALLYGRAWTEDEGVRQLFAVMPTYMIFDDHEIINNWNASPAWRRTMLRRGFEQLLVDGLVAYWVYQGWGNLALSGFEEHNLWAIMQQGLQSGEDVLAALRACVRRSVTEEQSVRWDYTIPTTPPIFVADVRADRPASLDKRSRTEEDHPRIMSQSQMGRLQAWMQASESSTSLVVSSVPILLPPLIGLAQYMLGTRPEGDGSHLRQRMAAEQQRLALRLDFEHWPVFGATWHEFVDLLRQQPHDLVILSGDVHFSYAIEAHSIFPLRISRRARCYQLVASPFKNRLSPTQRRLILGQAWLQRIFYSGLYQRILPLKRFSSATQEHNNLLLQGVVAMVTIWPHREGEKHDTLRQVYMGLERETLREIGATTF